jgi:hypothetical protein
VPGAFLLDERLQRLHESLVLGRSLKFAALASELAVDELAIRRNLKGATATWFASDGAALDVGLQLHLQSIEGGLVASGTTVFDVDNERHACTVLWVVRGRAVRKSEQTEKWPGKYQEHGHPLCVDVLGTVDLETAFSQ